MIVNKHNLGCFQDHFGPWMMDLTRFQTLYNLVMSENITIDIKNQEIKVEEIKAQEEGQTNPILNNTTLTAGGIRIISIDGTMMRGESSFGGTSTVTVRKMLRAAAVDPDTLGIMLQIDSPGGTVAGTDELAAETKSIGAIKPIRAHVTSLMASAAAWVGFQTSFITASRTSQTGSLGTVAVVHDMSEAAAKAGIKVHILSTGDFKGAFTPGSEVTKAQLADFQSIVIELNEFFKEAVMDGRGLSAKEVNKLFDGRVHLAEKALDLGLIDAVMPLEDAVRSFENEVARDDSEGVLAKARALKVQNEIDAILNDDPKHGFKNIADWGLSVMKAETGKGVDPRLKEIDPII